MLLLNPAALKAEIPRRHYVQSAKRRVHKGWVGVNNDCGMCPLTEDVSSGPRRVRQTLTRLEGRFPIMPKTDGSTNKYK